MSVFLNPEYSTTLLLYIIIYIFSVLLAFGANKGKCSRYAYWFCFFILWFFYVFNKTGADVNNYIRIYKNANLSWEWITRDGLEVGYRLLNAVIRTFVENEYVGLGVIKTISIFLFFLAIYRIREKVDVGFSVMVYVTFIYFDSFNLLRINLAGGICLWAFTYLMNKKYVHALVWSVIALSIHTGAILFLGVSVLFVIYSKTASCKKLIRILIIGVALILAFCGPTVIKWLLSSGLFFERYSTYLIKEASVGIMLFVKYIPLLLVQINLYRYMNKMDCQMKDLFLFLFVFSFCISVLGYSIGILTRLFVILLQPFIVMLPMYVKKRQEILVVTPPKYHLTDGSLRFMFVLYFFCWFIITLSGTLLPSGIQKFEFWF